MAFCGFVNDKDVRLDGLAIGSYACLMLETKIMHQKSRVLFLTYKILSAKNLDYCMKKRLNQSFWITLHYRDNFRVL